MRNPFEIPLHISEALTNGQKPAVKVDYARRLATRQHRPNALLQSFLGNGPDQTIAEGINLALNRLLDDYSPKDLFGNTSFLIHDGTGTGKGFQAGLAARALSDETGQPVVLATRRALVPGLENDLRRLGVPTTHIRLIATEEIGSTNTQKNPLVYAGLILDEAQDRRVPWVKQAVDSFPASRRLLLSATPFQNREEFTYFYEKLGGRRRDVRTPEEMRLAICELSRSGAMVHREFPYWGSFLPTDFSELRQDDLVRTQSIHRSYARTIQAAEPEERTYLQRQRDGELAAASDCGKVARTTHLIERALAENRKVIVFTDDAVLEGLANRAQRASGLTPFARKLGASLSESGITFSCLARSPEESRPNLRTEACQAASEWVAAANATAVRRFEDGLCWDERSGQLRPAEDESGRALFIPSATKVLIMPYSQAAGWSDLNQRFDEAPQITQLLCPTAQADALLQAIGRGSRRNNRGPVCSQLIVSNTAADRSRLNLLCEGLKVIGAVGSPTVRLVGDLVNECLQRLRITNESIPKVGIGMKKNLPVKRPNPMRPARPRVSW